MLKREQIIKKIASYVYARAVLEQGENNVYIYLRDIDKEFENQEIELPKRWYEDIELLVDIQNEIMGYPACDGNGDACWLDVKGFDEYGEVDGEEKFSEDDAYNLCLFTDYILFDMDNAAC